MRDVAKLAGVHQTTVSLALRGHPSIPEATRARVRKAADRLGYQPNPLVSALMASRRSPLAVVRHTTIAYVTSSPPGDNWRESQTLCEQYEGAREQAQRLGYNIEEFPLFAAGMTPERANQVLRSRGIIGLVIAPLRHGGNTLPLAWDHYAAVGVAFTLHWPNIPRVGSDHAQSVRLAIFECRRRGYRRIGLALQKVLLERVEEQWLAGYLVEHAYPKARAKVPPLIVEQWKKESFLSWFRKHRPDVVLTAAYQGAIINWLRSDGYAVPGDVGVVSLDLHVNAGRVAGINQDSRRIGAMVVNALVARLNHNERGVLPQPVRIHLMGEWVDGLTVRPPE